MGNPTMLAPCSGEGVFTGFGLLKRATAWLHWGHNHKDTRGRTTPFKLKTVGQVKLINLINAQVSLVRVRFNPMDWLFVPQENHSGVRLNFSLLGRVRASFQHNRSGLSPRLRKSAGSREEFGPPYT
jgi:hypothetical protein